MKFNVLESVLCVVAMVCAPTLAAEGDLLDVRDAQDKPVKLIFDTDIGGDIDDAFALGLIHVFADRGVCELLGVTTTNPRPATADYVAAVNANYGRPDVPVGLGKGFDLDWYLTALLTQKNEKGELEYPAPEGFHAQEAVPLLRKLLANAEDRSVVIVQVGMSCNLAALLDTPGDEISPLTGRELAEKKVRLVAVVGGSFALDSSSENYRGLREWNIICAIPDAQKFVREWPGEIVFSGYELGDRVRMVPTNLKRDYTGRSKILHDSFGHWTAGQTTEGFDHPRPTWDLTAVLFVLRPEEGRGYYTLSEPGDVDFDDEGASFFTPNPNGKRRCFLQDDAARIRVQEAFVNLCSEP